MCWAESSKARSFKKVGAQGGCMQPVGLGKPEAHVGFGVGLSQEGRYPSLGMLKEGGLRGLGQPIQEDVAHMGYDGGLKKARAPVAQSSCVESRLVKAIVGTVLWIEEGGTTGADEALLEEGSRYPHPVTCSFISFGDWGLPSSSSSFCGGKKRDLWLIGTWWRSRGHLW